MTNPYNPATPLGPTENSCASCNDGNGNCKFPYYGTAPHSYPEVPEPELGFKREVAPPQELPADQWPANYQHDSEIAAPNPGGYPGSGTYLYCLKCKRPD